MARRSSKVAERETPAAFVPPYPPSWVDGVTDWVRRLPIPWWLFYLAMGAASVLLFTAVQARGGAYVGGFIAWHVFLGIQPVYPLAAIHYLGREAHNALQEYQPAMDREYPMAEARYRLTVLPALPTFFASLGGMTLMVVWILQGPSGAAELRLSNSAFPFFAAFVLMMGLAYGPLVFFAVHQLSEVRRLYAQVALINLYDPDPLFAFSPLTARMAVAIAFITYGWSAGDPTTFTDPLSLFTTIATVSLALIIFILPLWGVHRRLVTEKRRALAQNGSRLKSTTVELHRRLDAGEIVGMDDLNKALANLGLERAHLLRVSTWPWQPETLRGLVAAIGLPVVIWLIQYGLQRMLR